MNIYVGNLSYGMSEDELRNAFGEFGDVLSVKILMDRETGRSRGFAAVIAHGAASRAAQGTTWSSSAKWQAAGCPVEFLSLSGQLGAQLRATVSSFGPLLLAKVLELNETQGSVLALVFKYCDDRALPLLDLSDLRAALQHLSGPGAAELADYGGMSKQTVGVLLRKMVELEQQGAEHFFGEPEFDLQDLLRTAPDGRGVVSILELQDVQDRPAVFSTFMMWMLARLYNTLPEAGDLDKPKLVFFFDEAHLLFDGSSKAFKEQVEQVVRLIRSKGVGVFFVTQSPKDVPADILGQLGNRVQHALRAFTPDDEKALRAAARTFPKTAFYDVQSTLQSLGIGEALVTVLDARGAPTPPFATPPATSSSPIRSASPPAADSTPPRPPSSPASPPPLTSPPPVATSPSPPPPPPAPPAKPSNIASTSTAPGPTGATRPPPRIPTPPPGEPPRRPVPPSAARRRGRP